MADYEREAQLLRLEGRAATAGALEAGLIIGILSNPSVPLGVAAVLVGLELGREIILFEKAAFKQKEPAPAPPPAGKTK